MSNMVSLVTSSSDVATLQQRSGSATDVPSPIVRLHSIQDQAFAAAEANKLLQCSDTVKTPAPIWAARSNFSSKSNAATSPQAFASPADVRVPKVRLHPVENQPSIQTETNTSLLAA
eukprot:6212608-Pleurochrysis_carterae.AAC.3